MSNEQSAVNGIKRYAQQSSVQEEHHREQLESALSWLEDDLKSIRRSLEAGTTVYADNISAQAGRVQDAALKFRLAGERRYFLDGLLSETEEAGK